jgi:NAD(P) transhydrogenase subunit alpha
MKIGVPKETRDFETRVALSPETAKKFVGLGLDVAIEAGAGLTSMYSDEEYKNAGATIAATAKDAVGDADMVLKVQRPSADEIGQLKKSAMLLCILAPYNDPDTMKALATAGITTYAMEFMPRITRAQSMDVLSSQSNLAGYKAVIDAASTFSRAMPMMMTSAGTIAPAKTFVMGTGVAGLQAIATAKRLGSVVSATDVRPVTKEQVESLGGKFVFVDNEESQNAQTEGGYAKEMSDDYKRQQAELIAATIAKQDIVITTALIPGRPAPTLVTDEMIKSMRLGSVIVDLAAESGGNVDGSVSGETTIIHGVSVIGARNMPGTLSVDASAFYAKNLFNFMSPFADKETGDLTVDWEDDTVVGTLVTKDGAVVHDNVKDL